MTDDYRFEKGGQRPPYLSPGSFLGRDREERRGVRVLHVFHKQKDNLLCKKCSFPAISVHKTAGLETESSPRNALNVNGEGRSSYITRTALQSYL